MKTAKKTPMSPEVTTLARLFLHACRAHRKPDRMLAKRNGAWRPLSSEEIETRVRRLSLGLRDLGLKPGDRVALLSRNRPEWVEADFAVLTAGGVTVPIYTSLPPDLVRYIIDNSGAKIIICEDPDQWRRIEAVRSGVPSVESVILLEGEGPEGARTLADVLERGKRLEESAPGMFERAAEAVLPGDLASVIYTSGTTGLPKGVMLSHGNFIANIRSLTAVIDFRSDDTALSFLPLSHVLERTASFIFILRGTTIAFAESVEAVGANLLEVRPTIVISVPRLFEKIYARVMDQVLAGSRLRRTAFVWALGTGKRFAAKVTAREAVPKALAFKRGLARRLVFSKITSRTGGRIRFFVCGGAPLSTDIVEFFRAMGLVILPGYGLTETSPVLTGSTLDDFRFGTVGKAIPDVELRIAEDGEILARGPNVMMGYYKNESATREAMAGGWFHTGDVGRFDDDGFLVITDRKKDIIVTSGGKNVAPQPIESLILLSPYVANVVVVGSTRKFISALIVPDFDRLESHARAKGIAFRDRSDLCRRPEVVDFLLAEIGRATPGLAPYERIKKIVVLDRDFEIGQGEVTPTLKVRRSIVEQRYADLIDGLYRER
jgi:long-chain acyl-CoA synthetase